MAAKLYMIGSPIGNLGDISQRTIDVLGRLDRLYCEDTRVTSKLLARLAVNVPLHSLSDDSPSKNWLRAIEYVQDDHSVGFITDAGMPGLSDPGRCLLELAWEKNVSVTVLPGPSSVGAMISLCPFSCHQFSFLGFAPRKDGEIENFISTISVADQPIFFFDSPKRVHKLMGNISAAIAPERRILIGRELTKLHEQVVLFSAADWNETSAMIPPKGEFTIGIEAGTPLGFEDSSGEILDALKRLDAAGFSKRDAARAVAAVMRLNNNDIKKATYLE